MPAFVVKAILQDRGILPPITATATDGNAAVSLVRVCLSAHDIDRIECKGLRTDVMKAAFCDQREGTIVIRSDWIWSGERPALKVSTEGARLIETAPKDREIMILGRLSPASDVALEWICGRFVDAQGWCSGADSALVQIHDATHWKESDAL